MADSKRPGGGGPEPPAKEGGGRRAVAGVSPLRGGVRVVK